MADVITEFVLNINTLTNLLLAIVMLISLAMIAYPDPTIRHNGIIAFLATIVAAIATNLPIAVV
jgi:predicted tellurium resistance membrane protein TerC